MEPPASAPPNPRATQRQGFAALSAAFALLFVIGSDVAHPSPGKSILGALLLLSLASALFPMQIRGFCLRFFGRIEYVQVDSPELERRVHFRYQEQIHQLTSLGFSPLFSVGQTFPVLRLLLLYPALILLIMLAKREVLSLRGSRFLIAQPVFVSGDRSTYAHPSGLGLMLHTVFDDGTLLISTNYGEDSTGPHFMRHSCNRATIADTWTHHQREFQEQAGLGNRVHMEINFPTYVAITR